MVTVERIVIVSAVLTRTPGSRAIDHRLSSNVLEPKPSYVDLRPRYHQHGSVLAYLCLFGPDTGY